MLAQKQPHMDHPQTAKKLVAENKIGFEFILFFLLKIKNQKTKSDKKVCLGLDV